MTLVTSNTNSKAVVHKHKSNFGKKINTNRTKDNLRRTYIHE